MDSSPSRSGHGRTARVLIAALATLLATVVIAQPSASGNARSQRPAACGHAAYLWQHLAACGWAGHANTGPALSACPGHALSRWSGSSRRTIHIRRSNRVIECRNITGCLSIEAHNVTVRNVRISCTSGRTGENANGTGVIKIEDGASAIIQHVTIDGMRGVHACIWHQGTSLVANRVNCSGVNDGIFSWADTGFSPTTGNHFTITNSYFHGFTTRTANGHIDGYQTEGAAHGLIKHNTYLMTSDDNNGSDSAIAIWDSLKSSSDITVQHNLIAGGGFSIYAEDYSPSESSPRGGYSVSNIHFVDNVFSRHLFGCVGYFGVWYPRGKPTDGWRRSGNTILESGANIDRHNPSYHGRSCT